MMPRKTTIVIGFIAFFSIIGCSKNSENPHSYSELDMGSKPKITMKINAPRYGSTNLPPDVKIHIAFGLGTMELIDAHQWVSQNAIIESYPSQKPISGKWEYSSVGGATAFTPDNELPLGDYLIRFPKASNEYVISPRPYNLFRVGSALRLMEIDILRDKTKNTSELMKVALLFSEILPKNDKVEFTIHQQAKDSSWTALSPVIEDKTKWVLSQALDTSKPLRLSISSPSLDGKWTGQAGSGSFDVEFVPSDYLVDGQVLYHVIPDLPINLPEGTLK